jgi:hypothetical protein
MEHAQLDSEDWLRIVAQLGGEPALAASTVSLRRYRLPNSICTASMVEGRQFGFFGRAQMGLGLAKKAPGRPLGL